MTWDDEGWNELVGDLYLSAMDREAAERLPCRFAALTGGLVASMWRLRTRDNAIVDELVTNLPIEAVTAYRGHYYQHDPWADAVRQARFNAVLRGADVLDDSTMDRSVYYNEFGTHHGIFHVIGMLMPLGRGAAETMGVVSIVRPRTAGAFEDGAVEALQRAVPHIRGAFRLREEMGVVAAGLRLEGVDAALESFGVAAVVLDGHGAVVRMNALAEGLAVVRNGAAWRGNLHRVLRLAAAGGERLAGLVAAAAKGEAGGRFRLVGEAESYVATVIPLTGRLAALAGPASGRVLLLVRRLEANRAGLAGVAAGLFGLTEAEAAVAEALADGLSPGEIAAARGVKVSTVRTLLQRAQDKMDCRNLRDLVRILAGLG